MSKAQSDRREAIRAELRRHSVLNVREIATALDLGDDAVRYTLRSMDDVVGDRWGQYSLRGQVPARDRPVT